ncbi:hypothetical protein [Zobellella taiwanensis]|uniref:hypothetical protein n=1 Tax=Zobellella taiwanensis TaxID=347535 RepID=UPI0011B2828C|nr:hypothetical protein [Zobellella taiwanensis]
MFGPFAFLAILIKNKEPSKKEKDSLKDGSMIKCPFCAETIKPEAKVCKHCDRDLPPNKNNIVEIHKTEYTSAIIDGDLKKLKELISTGGSIDSFKDDLIITADVYDRHEVVNYLKSIN